MTGAIPRSLMTTSELRDLDADEQRDQLYLPTPAGVAYAGSHLGVPQPQPCNIFTGDSGEAAGKSTGADLHRKAGSVPRETHRVDRGPTCSPAAPLRDENDTAPVSPTRVRRPYSRAAFELGHAGTTQTQLAGLLECSQMAVSRYLEGTREPPEAFEAVLEQLVGPEAAGRILAAIPERRRAGSSSASSSVPPCGSARSGSAADLGAFR